ncbi:uncharacterized protein BO72DRAFT_482847 [Aspergillus fijiensis CBS 313.89]|uniref:Uncharacterized protein n=1 Tax=Aspergillus fijiensis CBS 313.89 TaxID=1448319 RepID=A0A8G1RYN9_9EURO|nr:uncharacterized protein BO72DRAFT_482847 [Aspergillus fijiensis CBS 313.89]RAK81639.1 hypothetical protein BO72DRAFT_482847 [Aspergillus fijiensis CBS 313.89]
MSIPSRPGPGPERTYISPGVNPPTTIKDYPTLEVTEISLSPCMDAPHALEDSSIIAAPKRRRTPSPSSPAATTTSTKTISSSSSSSSSSTSRHRKSSLHSRHSSSHYSQHRRTATAVSITPITDQTTRREDLLALHRESCRLFQQQQQQQKQQQSIPPLTPRNQRSPSTSSNATTTSNTNTNARGSGGGSGGGDHSPISIHEVLKTPVRASTLPVWDYTDEVTTTTTTPKTTVTVIDWTSPSTRRREYEKIDKASSGMRGFWRRVAPKWCQSRARRMPFFEEKDGKGNYEGSVRRFRMDIPE